MYDTIRHDTQHIPSFIFVCTAATVVFLCTGIICVLLIFRVDILLRHRVVRQHLRVSFLGLRELLRQRGDRQIRLRPDHRGG